jgi:hypothetical protein
MLTMVECMSALDEFGASVTLESGEIQGILEGLKPGRIKTPIQQEAP